MFDVEVGENASTSCCACCGGESITGHGFIYKDGDAHAVYFVGWSPAHRERGVSMAIAVGRWDDSSTVHDRTCFGIEAYEGERQILFCFIDPNESPWAQTELLGQMISKGEARNAPNHEEVFSIAEYVVRHHPAVHDFLRVPP